MFVGWCGQIEDECSRMKFQKETFDFLIYFLHSYYTN